MRPACLAALLLLSCLSCRSPAPPAESDPPTRRDPSPPEPSRLYLVLGGDVMLQEQIHLVAEERGGGDLSSGYAWILHSLAPVLEELRSRGEVHLVVNLESPVASERREPRSYPPRFNGPAEALEGLVRAGVTGVTLANNHALDQGRRGLLETLENVRRAGLLAAGAGADPDSARAPMILGGSPRVALLSYFLRPRSKGEPEEGPAVAILDERSIGEVSAARERADAVVVTIHWVGEFVGRPREAWVEWAEALVLAGADAVVCHGTHVLGPSEIVEVPSGRQALIAYSLGNLVSNMGWEVYPGRSLEPGKDSSQRLETRQEALAVLEIAADPGQPLAAATLVPVWLMDNRYAVFREGAGPRLIYPLPLPGCELPDPVPCFPASRPAECEAIERTLRELVSHPAFEPFCAGPVR